MGRAWIRYDNILRLLTFILIIFVGVEVDGDYVPQSPAKLLLDGKFHRNIRIMIGQNAAEVRIPRHPLSNEN